MAAGDLPKTIVEEGKLPEERFENATQLREYCQTLIQADNHRTSLRARVENLFNGFPSYPRGRVTEGFGWMPRVNYRELEGLISTQATPLYDLVTETPQCIEIEFDLSNVSDQEREDIQEKFAKHFTWLLFKRCRQTFNYNILLQQREMLLHGVGYHVNVSKRWIPRTPRTGHILFPDGAPLNFHEDGKTFMLREFKPGEDIYSMIKNEESAKKMGWEPDNVWKTLTRAQRQYQAGRTVGTLGNQALEIQRRMKRGDVGYSKTAQVGLWMNWVYQQEYDGRWSLYGIEENIVAQKSYDNKGYLFRKRFAEDEAPVSLFPFDIGNGEIDSVRGLGMRAKDFFELSNRMKNAMVAQVLIAAFPQVSQTVPDVDPDKSALMRWGAMSRIPYGFKAEMIQFPSLNNTGIALSKELRETLGENLAAVQGGAPEPRDRETAYSFSVRAQDSARISNGQLSLYESNLQHFYDRTVRLLLATPSGQLPYQRLAREFRERCKRDGIPDSALKVESIVEIREQTSQGAGSAAARFQSYMTLIQSPVYANAPESKKIAIERALVATSLGQVSVDRFARSMSDGDIPNSDDSLATVESSTLAQGGDAQVADGQDHVKHAKNALDKADQIEQQVRQEQIEPQQAFVALKKLLDHAGEHLQKLQDNIQKQNEFKQLEQQWDELAKFTQQLGTQLQQQQDEPSPQAMMSEDGQIKMAKVQQDGQIKAQKAQGDMALKARKQQFNEVLQDRKTAVDISRNGSRGR